MFAWKQRLAELERRRQTLHGLRRQLEALKPVADQHAKCALECPRASGVKHLPHTGEVTVALLPVCTSAVPFQQL
jgi:hypothetical protein